MPTAERQALVVLGMHRSGTSAISGVMQLLGATEPRNLMPPTVDNPTGYWESVRLMKFHDELLQNGRSAWDDWGPMPAGWFDSAVATEALVRLPSLLTEEFGDVELLLIKDPRICRLVPLWTRALEEQEINPLVVLTMRGAVDVAESLFARDGFDLRRGLLLWLRHVLDAEHGTRALRRTFVQYDDLLNDWRPEVDRMTDALGMAWPRPIGVAAEDISKLLDVSHRHHNSRAGNMPAVDEPLSSWVLDVTAALDALRRGNQEGATAAQATLDQVRSELDRAAWTFLGPVREEVDQLRSALSRTRNELATTRAASEGKIRAAADELDAERQSSTAKLEQARRDLEATHTELATISAALEEERLTASAELERARRDIQTAHDEMATVRATLEQERLTATAHAARLSELEGRLTLLHQQNHERVGEIAMLTRRMLRAETRGSRAVAKRRDAVARSKSQLAELEKELSALHSSKSWRVTAPLRALTGKLRRAERTAPDPEDSSN